MPYLCLETSINNIPSMNAGLSPMDRGGRNGQTLLLALYSEGDQADQSGPVTT